MKGLLLSGGLDSTALAYMLRPQVAFNIDYGQKAARAERVAAQAICKELDIDLIKIDIDCSSIGSGDLVGSHALEVAPESDWWPFRNQLLITMCAMKAVAMGCSELVIGTVSSDSYHVDGSASFIDKISSLISMQEGGLSVTAPAMNTSTAELIERSGIPFSLLAWSHSCHKADLPCLGCRGCNKHYYVMEKLGKYGNL